VSELDELVSKNCEYCDTGEFEVEGGVRYIFEVVIESVCEGRVRIRGDARVS
jgi:hypothetical protein